MPQVVTCLLEHEGKILVLKRSALVSTYRGLWGGVAGYIEELESPYEAAVKEIREEVGVTHDALDLVKQGDPLEITDTYEGRRYDWVIYPFLFHVHSKDVIQVDWEHEEYHWIAPSMVKTLNTVPGLGTVVRSLLGSTEIL